jgi:hypothetical protein
MTRKVRAHQRIVAAFLLVLSCARCADNSLLGPVAAARDAAPAAVRSAPANGAAVPFSCFLGWKSRNGAFQFRQIEIKFPASEMRSGGARRAYLYRGGAGGELVQTAACAIPATDRAARRMDRMFNARRDVESGSGGYTTLSCPEEGCPLAPVTATACMGGVGIYPNCGTPVDVDYAYNCFYDGNCPGGGGGGGGGAGGGGGPAPQEAGPLLWAACIVTLVGAELSVTQVADLFSTWYYAERDVTSAQRIMDAMAANPGSVSAEMFAIYQLRLDLAIQRRDDARSAMSSATTISGWALAGAALACSAAVFAPTA